MVINATIEELKEIQTICKYNGNIADDNDAEGDNQEPTRNRKNRDITMVLSPDDVVYLTNARNKNKPVYKDGQQIKATYIGRKKFSFEEREPKSSSNLALELINEFALNADEEKYITINGNDCWMKEIGEEGKTKMVSLSALYDAMVEPGSSQN